MIVTLPEIRWLRTPSGESPERRAANIQEPIELGNDWTPTRLHTRGQLDGGWLISGILHAAAMRFHSDWRLSPGSSEIARERREAFNAAKRALGPRYEQTLRAIVLDGVALRTVGEALGHKNRGVASAVGLERLNAGLRRLAVHFGLLAAG